MRLKDIGRFSDFIKGIKGVDKTLDIIGQGQVIGDFLKDIDKIEDANKVLRLSGVSKDVAQQALYFSHFSNTLDDFSDKADEAGNKIKNIDVGLEGVGSKADKLDDVGNVLVGLKDSIVDVGKGIGSFVAKNPVVAIAAGLLAVTIVASKYVKTYDTLKEKFEESSSNLATTQSELSSVENELSTVQSQIKELESFDGLTFAQESELSKLRLQNDELERQKAILETLEKHQTKVAATDASNALKMKKLSLADSFVSTDMAMQGKKQHAQASKTVGVSTVDQNVIENIEALKQYEIELANAEKAQADMTPDTSAWKSQQKEIDELTEKTTQLSEALGQDIQDLNAYRNAFINQDTGKIISGYEDEVASIDKALDSYSEYVNGISGTKAKKLDEIFGITEFSYAQQELVDAFRNGEDISLQNIKDDFPELVAACNDAGISVQELYNQLQILAQSDGVTKLESDFAEFQTSAVSAINSMDKINSAMANSYSGKGLSIEIDEETGELTGDILNVISAYQDLEGYDAGMLFEKTANGVQLNREALRQLQAQQEAIQKQKFAEKQLELQNKLNEAKEKQSNFEIGSDDYSAYQTEINSLNNQLETVNQLASAYNGATSAYQKWLAAQSNGEAGDMYRNVSETMEERGKELFDAGRYNSEEFRAIADYFSYEDLSTAPMEKVKEAWTNAAEARKNYFTGDKTGIDNFMNAIENDAELQAAGIVKTLEDGTIEFQAGTDEILAKKFNLSLEAVQAILSAATEYNDKIRVGDTSGADNLTQKLAEATAKAEEAKTKLKELQDAGDLSTKLNFDIDVSKLDESGIEEYISNLESLKIEAEAEFGADSSEVEYVNDLLEEANARKEQLAQSSVVDIEVSDDDLETLGEQLSSIPENTSANVSVIISNDDQLESVVNQIESVPLDSTAHFTFDVQNAEQADVLEEKIATLNASRGDNQITYTLNVADNSGTSNLSPSDVSVTASVIGQTQVDALKTSIDSVKNKSVSVKAATTGIAAVTTLANQIAKLRSKTITLTTVKETVTKAEGTLKMPAHASGTAYNVLNTIPYSAYANGNVSLPRNEKALVNEIGTEGLIREGKLMLIPGGMHFENLKKGDIILSASQMRALMNTGRAPGKGRAYAYGTISNAYSIGSWTYGGNGSSWGKSSGSRGSSGKSSNNLSSNSSSSSDSADEFRETLDEIEILLGELERDISNLDTIAQGSYRNWSERNQALGQEMGKVTELINVQQQAYNKYMEKANSIGLSADWVDKILNGKLAIEDITDESLKEKIDEFQKWSDEAKNCSDAILELQDDLADLASQKFENTKQEYEDLLSTIEHRIDMIDGSIDKIETQGYLVSAKMYEQMAKSQQDSISILEKEYSALQTELSNAMASGDIKRYSEEWYSLVGEIQDVEKELQDVNTELIETKNNMRELEWEIFDRGQDMISELHAESEFLRDLMSNEKMFNTDDASITEHGQATLGLHAVSYNAYMSQAQDYAKEIQKINAELASDPYNTILLDKRSELLKSQREMIENAEDEKAAIKDLVEEGYDTFLDVMDKLIEKRMDMFDNISDLYDFQKEITDYNKEIASLEKQAMALRGDDSETAKASIQQIKIDLEEARQNRDEAMYDKYRSDTEKMLNLMMDETELWINERLENEALLLQGVIDSTNTNASIIADTLKTEADNVGYELSEEMKGIWGENGSFTDVVTTYSNGFTTQLTTTNDILERIRGYLAKMVGESDKVAESETNSIDSNSSSTTNTTTPSSSDSSSNTPPQPTPQPTSSGDGTPIVGDKVTFASGNYFLDSEGTATTGNKNRGGQVYITKINNASWAKKPYHISTGSKLGNGDLGWVTLDQLTGYSTGGFIKDTGLFVGHGSPNNPEIVLKPYDSENFVELRDTLRDINSKGGLYEALNPESMFGSVKSMAGLPQFDRNNVQQNITIDMGGIEMHGVNDVETFAENIVYSFQHNRKVRDVIMDGTFGIALGKGRLGIMKY